jgi:hypothetical protein
MADPIYFHGGVSGLYPGDRILPPSVTGVPSSQDFVHGMEEQAAKVVRRDRVYLTTDVEVARMWAGLHPDGNHKRGGDVYRVVPDGDLEPDLDYQGGDGASVQAASALVVGIVKTGVPRKPYLPLLGMIPDSPSRPSR